MIRENQKNTLHNKIVHAQNSSCSKIISSKKRKVLKKKSKKKSKTKREYSLISLLANYCKNRDENNVTNSMVTGY